MFCRETKFFPLTLCVDSSTTARRTHLLPIAGFLLLLLCVTEIPTFNANSVDPDQTQHSAASDLANYLFGVCRIAFPLMREG